MTIRLMTGAAFLALGLTLAVDARAQGLQPGMRTMIQQGGIEPGPLLGAVLPGYGYAPGFGFLPRYEQFGDEPDPRWSYHRRAAYEDGRTWRSERPVHRRHRQAKRSHRHQFAR